jgi:hypothetical protein
LGKENEERVPIGKPERKVIARHEVGNVTSFVNRLNRFNSNVL